MDTAYVQRLIDSELDFLLKNFAAVLIAGPRASGKTTTAKRRAATVVRLDRTEDARPFAAAPDVSLGVLERPILLDEWQVVPEVLPAVKRAVDEGAEPGSFILTGSARAELLRESWAATGRVVSLTQWGFTERELRGRSTAKSFVDTVFDDPASLLASSASKEDLRSYLAMALRGTLPDVALRASERARGQWWESYIDQLIMRDASLAETTKDTARLRRYLGALGVNTAGVVAHKTLFDAADVSRQTGKVYDSLFELLFVLDMVPSWHSNQLSKVLHREKRYIFDPALVASLAHVGLRAAIRDGDLMGRLIDTFVASQLRPELVVARSRPRLHHLRLESGRREVDLVIEARDGRLAGVEVKAAASVSIGDARHLQWMRDQLGDRFVQGIVFHTGPMAYPLDDRIMALPISSIWT